MTTITPKSITEFLTALRDAMQDCDPALVQDAVYDAEEYLRAAVEASGRSEEEAIQDAMKHYGTPASVAEEYRRMERTVQKALRTPEPKKQQTVLGMIFGVYADPRAYASLFYMFLTLVTGIFYFTWAITGLSLSAGLAILIFGVPFFILFVASTRLLSLVEGRIVETLLGERMPRRPVIPQGEQGWMNKIKAMITDRRTWSTMLYMLLMLPVGIGYFLFALCGIVIPLCFVFAPLIGLYHHDLIMFDGEYITGFPDALMLIPVGVIALTAVLHIARLVGRLHGQLAKHLLVAI